jgi:adenosylcobyric acid synthase
VPAGAGSGIALTPDGFLLTSAHVVAGTRHRGNASFTDGREFAFEIVGTDPLSDLAVLRAEGWDIDIMAHVRRGGRVLGICAGYQMLGKSVEDPQRIEGHRTSCPGLNLLDVHSTMTAEKTLRPISGVELATGARVAGYEMHLGSTGGPGASRPMIRFDDGTFDGATSADGRIAGCHVHGLFADPAFRAAYLATLGARSTGDDHAQRVDTALDEIAAALESALTIDRLLT